ncbi:hypothetical protein [Bradyrhizobium sp. RT4b]|uniref:hypothetical protein n=1 Tax=Bradyrhizobium sp. RT4b TaxID=3156379 RepID=UPI0033975B5A
MHFTDEAALYQLLRVPVGQIEHLAGADLAHVVKKFAVYFDKHEMIQIAPRDSSSAPAIAGIASNSRSNAAGPSPSQCP